MSFPRYSEYKDSEVGWLGEVPGHWDCVPMKHLVRLQSGGTPSKERLDYWDGEIPWASAKDMKVDCLFDTQDHITEIAIEEGAASLAASGAVIVVVRGMILARAFPVTVAARDMAINQDLKAVLSGDRLRPEFVAWYLRGTSEESLRRLDEAGHGTKALRMEAWTTLEFALPSLKEQSAIAAFLDRETAKIDVLVAEQEKLIALLKEKRQAVISHAVTKGLNPDAPMKDSGIEWLGEVPAHWEVARVKHFVQSIEQGWSPQCEGFPVESDDEWGVLKVGCVNGGRFNPRENKSLPIELEALAELGVKAGDLLISRANTRELVGSAAVAEADYANLLLCDKLYRLRLDHACCLPGFLALYLGSNVARGQIELAATGASSSMVNIGQGTILEMSIALPTADEQQTVLERVNRESSNLVELTAAAEAAIGLLKERRAALISAAVTGKIDVRGGAEQREAA